uniref:Uncharacterized protein n=1 Tax=Chenopodium quinoa TaxID=63459 RepID=A0A803LXP1_CHEQI
MGVPAFYRWLVDKYPKIVVNAIEEHKPYNSNNNKNPNGLEFDNLYLDMNGIIHPCFHPPHLIATPTTFEQVFENIYAYIDRLISIVRPRKLLYLAIDGVAPRAKMNQQRARRFKNAKDSDIAEAEEKRLRDEFGRKGKKVLPKQESQVSDSNVITPGTEFMHDLSRALNLYIRQKLKNDPLWSPLEVILSDDTVPGEGEHKITSFIRTKRSLPGYDPNTRHCLYGLDADLIMLALATHELHFSILREDVLTIQEQAPISEVTLITSIQNATQHSLAKSSGDRPKPFFDRGDKMLSLLIQPQHYQFLQIWILREYLELDIQIDDPPENFVYDIERIIDDFVFLCFFVGNDFLPHMPTLDIHENAIDLLMHIYKKEFKNLGGYLVDMQRVNDKHSGYVKLKRVEKFILYVGSYEEKIFKKRTEIRDKRLRRISAQLLEFDASEHDHEEDFEVGVTDLMEHETGITSENNSSSDIQEMLRNTMELNERLKICIRKKSDLFRDGNLGTDKVKLGSLGWKLRYYKHKFIVEDSNKMENVRKEIVHKYTEGLCWVLLYYYSGVPSWDWFYPNYYGPFASDLKGLASVKVRFEKGSPFKPFDQLMAMLPPKSAHALPTVYQDLMTNSCSSIVEFYPIDFEVDVDGKRFLWQGICKLPFIDEKKLLNATKLAEVKLRESEAIRNVQTTNKSFTRDSNSFKGDLGCYLQQQTTIEDDIMCFNFELPAERFQIPRLLEGIQRPIQKVFENDIMETIPWHEYSGRPPITRYNKNAAVDAGTTIKTAGLGRGFESAGRGRGISSNSYLPRNNDNLKYVHQSENIQSTSTFPRNVSRGFENMRIQNSHTSKSTYNGTCNTSTHNSFWHSSNVVRDENASWRTVSQTRPSFSSQGGEGSSMQFRPCYANTPHQFMGRGRGRGRAHYSSELPAGYRKDCNRW